MSTAMIERLRTLHDIYRRHQVCQSREVTFTYGETLVLMAEIDALEQRTAKAEAAVDVQMERVAELRGQLGRLRTIGRNPQEDAA